MGIQLNCIKKNYLVYLSTLVGLQMIFVVAATAGILGLLDQNEETIETIPVQLHTATKVGQALLWVDCVTLVYSLLVLLLKLCAGISCFTEVATFGINVVLFVVYLIMCVLWGVYDTFIAAELSTKGSHFVIWMLLLLLTICFLAMTITDFVNLYWADVKEKLPDMPKTPTLKKPKMPTFKKPEFKKPSFLKKKKKPAESDPEMQELAESPDAVAVGTKVHIVSEVPSVTESLAEKLTVTIEQALERAIDNIAAKQAPAEPVVVAVEEPEPVVVVAVEAPEPVIAVCEAPEPVVVAVEVPEPVVAVEAPEPVVAVAEPAETEASETEALLSSG